MSQAEYKVADAMRKVALSIETELGAGERSWNIDAVDLVHAFLSIADQLDPPVSDREANSEDT